MADAVQLDSARRFCGPAGSRLISPTFTGSSASGVSVRVGARPFFELRQAFHSISCHAVVEPKVDALRRCAWQAAQDTTVQSGIQEPFLVVPIAV